MLHSIPTEKLGAFGEPITQAVQACVHCGFCLAACPTYAELGQEMDTPRGRIVLMKQVLEGSLPWESAQAHIDRCLGCLACEPACPSGVEYHDLINPFRALMRSERPATRSSGWRRFLESKVLPFPNRFRFAIAVGRLARSFSSWLPRSIRPMLELLPQPAKTPEQTISTRAEPRGRVALLTGCVQQVLEPDINAATVEVLARNGIEVVIPPGQGCCGGLAWHTGDLPLAQKFANQNVAAFPADVEAIVTNAAGCGSTMQEYDLILKGTTEEERAKGFCKRVVDVSIYLARKGFRAPSDCGAVQRVVYQDACHLEQAQRVSNEPRSLLKAIPGLQLVELAEPHLCCGSAGTYNLDQPEIADSLGRKKAQAILATGAQAVVSGNIGCITQLRMHLAKLGSALPVRHTMQVLRDAYAMNR